METKEKIAKYYDGYDEADALYDVDADPEETTDLRDRHPQLVARMRALLAEKCRPVDQIRAAAEQMRENLGILTRCDFDNTEERWRAPECARHAPEPMVKSRGGRANRAAQFLQTDATGAQWAAAARLLRKKL